MIKKNSITFRCQSQDVICLDFNNQPLFICSKDMKITDVKLGNEFTEDFQLILLVNNVQVFTYTKSSSSVDHVARIFLHKVINLKTGDIINVNIRPNKKEIIETGQQQTIQLGYSFIEKYKKIKLK